MTCSVHIGGLVYGLGIVYYYTPVVQQKYLTFSQHQGCLGASGILGSSEQAGQE